MTTMIMEGQVTHDLYLQIMIRKDKLHMTALYRTYMFTEGHMTQLHMTNIWHPYKWL